MVKNVFFLSTNDTWKHWLITDASHSGRSYDIETEDEDHAEEQHITSEAKKF